MSLLQVVKLYILKELAAVMIVIVQARNGTWNNEFVEFRAKFSFNQVALKERKARFHRCTGTRHLAEKQYLFVARPQSIGERRLERRKFHGARGSVGIRHASNARRQDARGVTRKARQRDNRGTVWGQSVDDWLHNRACPRDNIAARGPRRLPRAVSNAIIYVRHTCVHAK